MTDVYTVSLRLPGAPLQLPPTVQCTVRLPGDSKLAIGVNLNSCLFLCVSPATVCQAVQDVPRLIPHDNLNRNISDDSKADMGKIDGLMDGWIDGWIIRLLHQLMADGAVKICLGVSKNLLEHGY